MSDRDLVAEVGAAVREALKDPSGAKLSAILANKEWYDALEYAGRKVILNAISAHSEWERTCSFAAETLGRLK